MVQKIYHIRVNRNMESEIQYIKNTYNPVSCGGATSKLIQITLDVADEDAFIEDMASRGAESLYINNVFQDLSLYQKSVRDNKVMFQVTRNVPLSLTSTYTDVFPTYSGMPIPIDTTGGYRKIGMVILWNKNGGSGTHTIKLTKCNSNGTINNPEHILREFGITVGGYLSDFNYTLPQEFIDFRGFIKLQAKSTQIENPIFDGLWLYMIRR